MDRVSFKNLRVKTRLAAVFSALVSVYSLTLLDAADTTINIDKYFEVRDDDQPTKFIFSGDTRVARVTGSLSTNTRIQRLRLAPGWNLCSLAVTASNALNQITNSPSAILNSQSIFRWNTSTLSWLPIAPADTLPAGTVLWLRATTNTTLALTGTYSNPASRAIEAGGSFQSGSGLEVLPLLGVRADVALSSFDASDQQWQLNEPSIPFSDPAFPAVLAPGEAIFLNADAPATLEVPESALRVRYYHQDHLGSSSVMTDANGAVVEETAFHPFGTPRNDYQPRQIEENYKFTQKERDRESGLNYFEARYLAGPLARFTVPDPKYADADSLSREDLGMFLTQPQQLNLYSYVRNNPLKYTDPTGLDTPGPGREPSPEAEAGSTMTLSGLGSTKIDSISPANKLERNPGSTEKARPSPKDVIDSRKPEHSSSAEFSITRSTDKMSTDLFKTAYSGKMIAKAEITLRTKGGEVYLKIKMTDVYIAGYQIMDSSQGVKPRESIQLSASKVEYEFLKTSNQEPAANSELNPVAKMINEFLNGRPSK